MGALGKTQILSFVLGFSSYIISELTELLQSEDLVHTETRKMKGGGSDRGDIAVTWGQYKRLSPERPPPMLRTRQLCDRCPRANKEEGAQVWHTY